MKLFAGVMTSWPGPISQARRASSIADVLQARAHEIGADVVVAGAYGHPMLWEKLLGGVTHELLARMTLPIMMSH